MSLDTSLLILMIEEEREVYIKHFLDSISAVTNNYINENTSLIDVGTGAGFPGMPLKICLENLDLTLLDSLNKRINFLQEVANQEDRKLSALCRLILEKYIKEYKIDVSNRG